MPYDLKSILSSVKKDPASIRSLANDILSGKIVASGTSTLKTWAEEAISSLKSAEKYAGKHDQNGTDLGQKMLDKAYSWITGGAQPTKAARMYEKNDRAISEMKKDLANEASNIANTPERSKDKLASLSNTAASLGIDVGSVTKDVVQTTNGDWIPKTNAMNDKGVPGGPAAKAMTPVSSVTTDASGNKVAPVTPTAPGQIMTDGQQSRNQILDVASMGKYTPDQYDRLSDGSVVLKQGVTPISGTTKPYGGSAPSPSAPGSQATGDATAGTGSASSATAGSPDAGGAGASTGATGGDPATESFVKVLADAGFDTSTLTPDQFKTLSMMNYAVDTNAEANKPTVPPGNTSADWNSFFAQASAEMDPYYQEQFNQARQDLTNAVGFMTGEFNQAESLQANQFKQQQEQQAQQAADAGLARSGIRNQAETVLREQQRGAVASGRRAAQQQIYSLGSTFERAYGTSGLAKAGIPTLASQGNSSIGVANQQLGYNPLGVDLGTVGAERKANETGRAQELASGNVATQYGTMLGVWPSNLMTPTSATPTY